MMGEGLVCVQRDLCIDCMDCVFVLLYVGGSAVVGLCGREQSRNAVHVCDRFRSCQFRDGSSGNYSLGRTMMVPLSGH